MKLFLSIIITGACFTCFSQSNSVNVLKEINNVLSVGSDQDTSKPKNNPAGQSNLAVSDPGSSSGKDTKSNTKSQQTTETEKKAPVNTSEPDKNTNSTEKMAVTDPGSSGNKPSKGKNQKTGTTGDAPSQPSEKETVSPK